MKKSSYLLSSLLLGLSILLFGFRVGTVSADVDASNPEISLNKEMLKTKGYKPTATDSFTITFTQLDNEAQYWVGGDFGNDGNTMDPVSPKIDAPIPETVIAGTGATQTIDADTKTASAKVTLKSYITKPGLYTYEVTEKEPSTAWTKGNQSYIVKVKATTADDGTLKYEVVALNKDTKKKVDFSSTGVDGMYFENTLKERTKDVTVSHIVAGTGGPTTGDYTLKVKISKPDGSEDTQTVTIGAAATPGKDATVKAVPVGSTIKVIEDPADNNPTMPLGNASTTVRRARSVSGITETNPTDGAKGAGVLEANYTTAGYLVTEDGTNEANENTFLVTDTYQDIINTGISILTSPFVLLLVAVAAGVTGYVVIKRRANI